MYADESATQAVSDGGADIYIHWAASSIETADSKYHHVMFLSDILSILKALSYNKDPLPTVIWKGDGLIDTSSLHFPRN